MTMKKLFKRTLSLILYSTFFLASIQVNGQNATEHFISMLGQPDSVSIQLRWATSDYDTWKEGNTVGYTLERYTTHINGVDLDATTILNSKLTLATQLLPLAEADWDSQFLNNNFAELAKGTLYAPDDSIEISASPSLADALTYKQSKESRFIFSLFAAEQDFEVAEGLALAFEDTTTVSGHTYMYYLKMNSVQPEFEAVGGILRVDTDSIPQLPVVTGLEAEAMDKGVALQWELTPTKEYYSSFDLERSTDSLTFVKVNELPFIFGSEGEEDPDFAVYRDSLENNTTTYYYRVRGRTAFGTQGPPSDVISISGMPSRVNLFLKINDYVVLNDGVELKWASFDSAFESNIIGFNLYRSEKSDGGFEVVNSNLIATTERSYQDGSPVKTAYYKLEAIDHHDRSYLSPAALIQPSDSTPPAIPVGLKATFVTPEKVQLRWDANSEEDLKGYRVFMSNGRNANFVQLTEYPLVEEQFTYEVDPKLDVDSIFFKVLATDHRDNYSDLSSIYSLDRPDVIAPSKPVLLKASPTPAGIEVGFRFSSSKDAVNHVLERKIATSPDWEAILEIPESAEEDYETVPLPGEITSTSFIDTTILERREYQYRFLSYDADKNVSSSSILTVRPYDSGKRGTIETFTGSAKCVAIDSIVGDAAYDALEAAFEEYYNTNAISGSTLAGLVVLYVITDAERQDLLQMTPYEVYTFLNHRKEEIWGDFLLSQIQLEWEYSADDQLVDFQIYRSAEGSAMMLYKTLKVTDLPAYAFEDEDVKPGNRYFYQIMARHLGNGFSERSGVLMVKVPKF